jgi:subtilase family serine protease
MRIRLLTLSMGLVLTFVLPVVTARANTATPIAVQACGPVPDGYARCLAEGMPSGKVGSSPPLTPAQIKSIYYWPTGPTVGAGQTVAIVSAFDAPTIEADLGVFDNQFGLPACTTANGCLTELNQTGGTNLPTTTDDGWAVETHLDVEWAHAIAPGAKILLVEADTNATINLLRSVDVARQRAAYVSNSWGSTEFPVELAFEGLFTSSPGVSFFFGTGDEGAVAPLWPAMSPNVTAVGGTTLQFNKIGVFTTEVGWSGGGGGCSQFETASGPQGANPGYNKMGCAGKRAIPDVAADADPNTGVAVYDSQNVPDIGVGWFPEGGTSLATPLIAARAAGTGAQITQSRVYQGGYIVYREIHNGNNGFDAKSGYDLVAGLGSWLY